MRVSLQCEVGFMRSDPRGPAFSPAVAAARQRRPPLCRTAARAEAAEPGAGEAAPATPPLQQLAAPTASSLEAAQQVQLQRPDPYNLAGHRLRSLLNGVGDGEEEMLNSMLEEQPAANKLVLCLMAGGLVSGGAATVCWLCGLDPAGGASLSTDTLRAAALGGVAAAPLVALKALLWSEPARQQLPFLDDIHKAQVDTFRPVLANLNVPQTLLLLASEVVPGVLILLPATTGGITKSLQMYCDMAGTQPPEFLPGVFALMITASIAGMGKIAETSVTLEEYEVVRNALENADRYYRVMAMDRDSTPADAQRAADAFRSVALTWIAGNQVAGRFAAVLRALEVIFLGVLWQQTGDLAAPMIAALGAAAVDFAHIQRYGPAKA